MKKIPRKFKKNSRKLCQSFALPLSNGVYKKVLLRVPNIHNKMITIESIIVQSVLLLTTSAVHNCRSIVLTTTAHFSGFIHL